MMMMMMMMIVVVITNFYDRCFSFVLQKFSNLRLKFSQQMEDNWIRSDCVTVEGFPQLFWETLQRLGYTEPPMYYGHEHQKDGMLKCAQESSHGVSQPLENSQVNSVILPCAALSETLLPYCFI
jgi:hypothetical protein